MDAVIERADGEWMAAEIQLGSEKLIEQGVNSLLRLRSRVETPPEPRVGYRMPSGRSLL